ncbi:SprT family zinc-dependent metalloprotease [Thalassospira sp.]|uniref:M48 family metallopeptidase n=1 Tax=Thalassospira sp. TaxID=1912094 RepID=UPI0032EF21D3
MGIERLSYGDEVFEYEVIVRRDLTNKVQIHVHPNGLIQVDKPDGANESDVKKAIRKRARWIKTQVDIVRDMRAHALPREYVSGETHFYLGRRYRLKIEQSSSPLSSTKLLAGRIVVEVPNPNVDRVRGVLRRWYKERAADYLGRRLEIVASDMRWVDETPHLRLTTMKRQWGNCSPNGEITLNPALVKAPRDCIDYVLTHELCHLREHHHGLEFYQLLASRLPNWKAVKSKLDSMAELLLV